MEKTRTKLKRIEKLQQFRVYTVFNKTTNSDYM